ncbi:MAG TPA: sigma-70 family RNA polymerase sigma factor [Polyangiaceae bacterium]|nr:sigma-70 family RNA polymerase sigma factor [Polyangiaceae bacterium]
MALAASGDSSAIGELYDRYARVMLPVALRVLGTRTEAEDVLHDTFVSLPERARHYAPERGGVAAWLVILVRNLSIDRVRRTGRRQTLNREHLDAEPPPTPRRLDPEALASLSARRDRVCKALASLPDAQRETLIVAFFEGLTYAEIAEKQSVSLGTVKSRAARALAALREALAREGFTADDLGAPKTPR